MNRLTTAPRSAGGGVPADALDMMQGPSDTGLLDRFPPDLGKCLVLRLVVVSPHPQAGRQRRGDQRPALGKARPLDAVLLGLVEESAELVKVSDVGLGEPDELAPGRPPGRSAPCIRALIAACARSTCAFSVLGVRLTSCSAAPPSLVNSVRSAIRRQLVRSAHQRAAQITDGRR
jgi:hypothetical protein